MGAKIMDGAAVARSLLADTKHRAARYLNQAGRQPMLAAVLVGDDAGSRTYVAMKLRRCEQNCVSSIVVELPAATTTTELVKHITDLSADPAVDGILLQHPVPVHIDERAAFEAINPAKDVDGVTMHSFAAMSFGEPGFLSCTPGGIVRLLDAYDVDVTGRHAVVVGRSPILGKPVGMLLLARDATVTFCHSKTVGLADVVRQGDLVVAAVGRPELIRGEWIKPGAVVVDAGYNPGNIGDVDFAGASERASLVTPVPGGGGPMTIAVLLQQTVAAAEQAR
jgi:methylenetetrahydrofolate dehydrogenase (NADP+) / methenyltetrahydrofolate cyclohydrolase